jgi:hypothetical protein
MTEGDLRDRALQLLAKIGMPVTSDVEIYAVMRHWPT